MVRLKIRDFYLFLCIRLKKDQRLADFLQSSSLKSISLNSVVFKRDVITSIQEAPGGANSGGLTPNAFLNARPSTRPVLFQAREVLLA